MSKTTKTNKGLFNKDGEPITDHEREFQERVEKFNKKLEQHEKTRKEGKALYDKAIELLKSAAEKDDNFSALLYGIHLAFNRIVNTNVGENPQGFNAPWEDKERFAEAIKYITYAATVPSEAWEIATVVQNRLMEKCGYTKAQAYPLNGFGKDPRVVQAENEYITAVDAINHRTDLTQEQKENQIRIEYGKYIRNVQHFYPQGVLNNMCANNQNVMFH